MPPLRGLLIYSMHGAHDLRHGLLIDSPSGAIIKLVFAYL
jgi:hypothetical protein